MSHTRMYFARKRRKSLFDPSFRLKRTHTFPIGTTSIITGDVLFPSRNKAITVAVTVRRTGANPAGVVFELGSSIVGLAIWFAAADDKIYAAAGNKSDFTDNVWVDGDVSFVDGDISFIDGDPGTEGLTLEGTAPPIGQKVRIVFSVIPTTGKARLWINGDLVASGDAEGAFPNGWSDAGAGAVGEVNTTITERVAVGDRITLADVDIISPVSIFVNQRPRQFFEVA